MSGNFISFRGSEAAEVMAMLSIQVDLIDQDFGEKVLEKW